MARKDIFANITSQPNTGQERRATTPGYATRGASRSMINSLSELAEKAALADQAMAGDALVDLDPDMLEASFVTDRMGEDETAFQELVEAIRERGQDTPVLVRPHPSQDGRYQIVFGHRRVRVAKLLGRPVKAVVRQVSDVDHVIAQGQENSARENLSFIERAVFAQNLSDLKHDRRTVQTALSIDGPMLTRMLSVTSRVPAQVITAIGAAKGIGRDKWLELAQQIEHPATSARAGEIIADELFSELPAEARFDFLNAELKKAKRQPKRSVSANSWQSRDARVSAEYKSAGKGFSIALKSKDAAKFGRFIAQNLERLHEEFLESVETEGD